MPNDWKEVFDWIMAQGHKDNYLYFHEKDAFITKKRAELMEGESELEAAL